MANTGKGSQFWDKDKLDFKHELEGSRGHLEIQVRDMGEKFSPERQRWVNR